MARRFRLWCATALAVVLVSGCAVMGDPLRVQVVGIEPLEGQGMELRFAAKLRVQNPNESAIDYDGVAVDLEVRGKIGGSTFGSVRFESRGQLELPGTTATPPPQ